MKKHSLLLSLAMLTLIAISLPSPAAAKDAVWASVTNPQPPPDTFVALMENGNPLSPGTFAVGTIQLFYQASISDLDNLDISFDLSLGLQPSISKGQSSICPATVRVAPVGSNYYIVDPNPWDATIPSANPPATACPLGQFASTTFHLTLTNLGDVEVGDDLVANLRMQITESGHFIDTPTNIQVHVLVLEDPSACIQAYNFITDMAFTSILDSVDVNVSSSKNNGPRVTGTVPGQLSDNVLVVSTCAEPQTFDLLITLDPNFEVKGHNGVATYLAGGYSDPSTFDIDLFGTGTKQGQNLFLAGITLPPNSSFLATVHMGLITGGSPALLPVSGSFDGFAADLLVPGWDPNGLLPFILFSMADPNPADSSLGFTIK